jgi:hypothetical protein
MGTLWGIYVTLREMAAGGPVGYCISVTGPREAFLVGVLVGLGIFLALLVIERE